MKINTTRRMFVGSAAGIAAAQAVRGGTPADSGKTAAPGAKYAKTILPPEDAPRPIRHSDVVMSWVRASDEEIKAYGVNVWGWGKKRDFKELHDAGLRIVSQGFAHMISPDPTTKIGSLFNTHPVMKKTRSIDIAGETVHLWFWARVYPDGTQSYRLCTNNPAYRQLRKMMVQTLAREGADVLNIDNFELDDHRDCFCDYCVAGFRSYLAVEYSEEELKKRGIEDIGTFDFRDMVRKVATTREAVKQAYREDRIPLLHDYYEYTHRAGFAWSAELKQHLCDVTGRYYVTGANTPEMRPHQMGGIHFIDYCTSEILFGEIPGGHEVYAHKFAEALNLPFANWPTAKDCRYLREKGRVDLLKTWIATSYALGGNLMIPTRMFCKSTPEGIEVYDPPVEEVAPVYQFIRKKAHLFDGYSAVEQVKVLYSNLAERLRNPLEEPVSAFRLIAKRNGMDEDALTGLLGTETTMKEACVSLLHANIPYGMAVAGDELLQERLEQASLLPAHVVVPQPLVLDPEQEETLLRSCPGNLFPWRHESDTEALLEKIRPQVKLRSDHPVWIIPRRKANDTQAPLVVHLINRSYDADANRNTPQNDVVVHLSQELIGIRDVKAVRMHTPGKKEQTLKFEQVGEGISMEAQKAWNGMEPQLDPDAPCEFDEHGVDIRVPRLETWALLEVEIA